MSKLLQSDLSLDKCLLLPESSKLQLPCQCLSPFSAPAGEIHSRAPFLIRIHKKCRFSTFHVQDPEFTSFPAVERFFTAFSLNSPRLLFKLPSSFGPRTKSSSLYPKTCRAPQAAAPECQNRRLFAARSVCRSL